MCSFSKIEISAKSLHPIVQHVHHLHNVVQFNRIKMYTIYNTYNMYNMYNHEQSIHHMRNEQHV